MTTRRRVLGILAGVAALPFLPRPGRAATAQWRGVALGAEAYIVLDHPDADVLIPRAVAEIRRLEAIFSLFRADSELTRLNRDGRLEAPSVDMIELASLCTALHHRTHGAFDPTVQPLWVLHAEAWSRGADPQDREIEHLRRSTGWQGVALSPSKISFGHPGMSLTLNGIAQGFIADKVVSLLRRHGVENVLVNTGEIAAAGRAQADTPWSVGLPDGSEMSLSNRAVATSAPLATTFDRGEIVGHIIDPRTGRPGGRWTEVTVQADSAAEADGLSTAFCLMSRAEIEKARRNSRVKLFAPRAGSKRG